MDLDTLNARVKDFGSRGLARRPDQSFEELFEERFALYTRYADITIPCAGLSQEEVCAQIIKAAEGGPEPEQQLEPISGQAWQ